MFMLSWHKMRGLEMSITMTCLEEWSDTPTLLSSSLLFNCTGGEGGGDSFETTFCMYRPTTFLFWGPDHLHSLPTTALQEAGEQFISWAAASCWALLSSSSPNVSSPAVSSFSAGKPHDVAEEEGCVLAGAEVAEGEKGGGAGGASQRAATAGHPTAAGGMEEGEQVLYPGWFCTGWVSCWPGCVWLSCWPGWVWLYCWPGWVGDCLSGQRSCVVSYCLIGPGGWVAILCGGWLSCWPSCVVGDCLAGHPVWWVTVLLAILCGGWPFCWP